MQTQPHVSFDDVPIDERVRATAYDHIDELEQGLRPNHWLPRRHRPAASAPSPRRALFGADRSGGAGAEIVVNRDHHLDHAHEDVYVALPRCVRRGPPSPRGSCAADPRGYQAACAAGQGGRMRRCFRSRATASSRPPTARSISTVMPSPTTTFASWMSVARCSSAEEDKGPRPRSSSSCIRIACRAAES